MRIRKSLIATGLITMCIVSSVIYALETDNLPVNEQQLQLYSSALDGSAEAQFEVGLLYEYGKSVDQDDAIALSWYEKSALQNHSGAQYRLAVMLDNGWGSVTDKPRAFKLYEAAANRGHELAQYDLAIMYFNGVGTNKDRVQAYKWLKIAVLNGSPLMQKHLARVADEMSADEVAAGDQLAQEYIKESGQ